MSSPNLRELFFQMPELDVEETETHRCATCSEITYEKFRATNPLAELTNPKTVTIGSFSSVAKSAFGGCWVCRIILRQISQTATSLPATLLLHNIATIGLRLSLDDELSVRCYDKDGYSYVLNDISADVIDLMDGEWDDERGAWTSKLCGRELDWTFDEDSFPPTLTDCGELKSGLGLTRFTDVADSNRLILNPDVDNGRLLAISWLSNCCKTHKSCPQVSELPELPTRVLDVGEVGKSHSSRLIMSNGLRAEYVTLSHCWGKTHHTMSLTHDNLESTMAGVEDSEMPKTFQEAIMIVRGLGQRYLWIDSMCIIQPTSDDNSDWEKEGGRMGDIYRNSTLTIAASGANDNTEGCLFGKSASQFDVHPVPLFQQSIHRNWDEFSKMMGRDPEWFPVMHPKPASWLHHVQNSPLNSRAWVLQERILSPRILHCTMQGFFWECSELRASEYEPLGSSFDYFYRDHGLLNIRKLLTCEKEQILGSCWRKIVERYCQLGLSVSSDRLPALAGLARVIQGHTNDQYIAGHWKSSLLSSLLWFRLASPAEDEEQKRQKAPSWSWASISGEVKFTSLETDDYPSRRPKDFNLTAELMDVTAEPLGTNQLCWISSSKLILRGHLRDGVSVGGLPRFEARSITPQASWRGYKPMGSEVGQLGAIEISSESDFIPVAADESKLNPRPRDDGLSKADDESLGSSTTYMQRGEVGEPEIDMAPLALDHEKFQAATKEYMETITSSQQWNDLQKAGKLEEEEEAARPTGELIQVTYDDSKEEPDSSEGVALFEMLRSTDDTSGKPFSEGLVLRQVGSENTYMRIGYFRSGHSSIFNNALRVDVVLV